MEEIIQIALAVYAIIAFMGAFVCMIAAGGELTDDNPIIYALWPVVAINALVLHVIKKWRK